MRTTVDLPDLLLRRAKAAAALEGKSLKTFLSEAVTQRLEQGRRHTAPGKRVKLPLVKSATPGTLEIDADTISEALLAEDLHALAGH